ncbi:TetR/AcrR family transcriptional regulator [Liberiplasma polymorphum]|uniref:TetR/AcrR family transcriptional regulator n=1 Tax=Liberiplasma polymorphum TaxID=3374570 RepID=UPI003774FC0A
MKEHQLKNELIKAGFKAFAKQDYKKVSTNEIVKAANVSKGLLFHYFDNKETFYFTLYEMAWQVIHRDIFVEFPFENRDLFDRLKYLIIAKSTALQKHKVIAMFLKRIHLNNDESFALKRTKIYNNFTIKNYKRMFENIDESKFRSSDYLDEIYKIVTWTFNRITSEWEKAHPDKENDDALRILEQELTHYIEFFKTFFYK